VRPPPPPPVAKPIALHTFVWKRVGLSHREVCTRCGAVRRTDGKPAAACKPAAEPITREDWEENER